MLSLWNFAESNYLCRDKDWCIDCINSNDAKPERDRHDQHIKNMQQQQNTDILKAVGVRFIVNPELGSPGVVETEEMCRKTVASLDWINTTRPRVVLVADTSNKDKHAVAVRALGRTLAYVDASQAPEIRGMLKATPRGMLTTSVVGVEVYKHGYFYVRKPVVSLPYQAEEIGVDWSQFKTSELILLPDDYFVGHDELSMVLFDELLPDLQNVTVEELGQYVDLWLKSVRYNQSCEVHDEMKQLISVFSADRRKEVRDMAMEIDHIRTKKGTKETLEEIVGWWHEMIHSSSVVRSFELIKLRCQNDRVKLLLILGKVEALMQKLPGDLYNDVGSAYHFFSHLHYLAPPMISLRGVLSLYAVRTLICNELALPLDPFFGERQELADDVKAMPTTIGKVMEFADKQCREYAEVLTVQRLAKYLREEYLGWRETEIEAMLDKMKPAANITIGTLNGSATGEVTQNINDGQKLLG